MATIEDLQTQITSLQLNEKQLYSRVRLLEKRFETLNTPVWKRILFRIDGWPAWHYVVARPNNRPWRKRWTS